MVVFFARNASFVLCAHVIFPKKGFHKLQKSPINYPDYKAISLITQRAYGVTHFLQKEVSKVVRESGEELFKMHDTVDYGHRFKRTHASIKSSFCLEQAI